MNTRSTYQALAVASLCALVAACAKEGPGPDVGQQPTSEDFSIFDQLTEIDPERVAKAVYGQRAVLFDHILSFMCVSYFTEDSDWYNYEGCPGIFCYDCRRIINPKCAQNYQLEGGIDVGSSQITYRCKKQGGAATNNPQCLEGFNAANVQNNRYDCQAFVDSKACFQDHWRRTSLAVNGFEVSYTCYGLSY